MEVEPNPLPVSDVRDWSELPSDAISVVFSKLGAIEILMGPGLVCRSWLEAAKTPDLWRFVDMTHDKVVSNKSREVLCAMAKVAIDRSAGKLEAFWAKKFVSPDILDYIGKRTNSLKSIRLTSCPYLPWQELATLAVKFPLLEELEYSDVAKAPAEFYYKIGRNCPRLTRLRINTKWIDHARLRHERGEEPIEDYEEWQEEDAFAIANTMHELRLLQISGNTMTNRGVYAIVKHCPHLECLDLHGCRDVYADDELRAWCAKIRHVRLPRSGMTTCDCEGESIFEEDEESAYADWPDYEMEDNWNVYWDDISLPSDGGSPDLSNMTCDDVTNYSYIHDYYSL